MEPVRRLEVFTGAGRRRTWSNEDKARIIAEIVTSGASVSAVARLHGLSPQQLFGWRRQLQQPLMNSPDTDAALFVPAVVDAALSAASVRRQRQAQRCKAEAGTEAGAGIIEIEIDGVTVRIGRGADSKTVMAVLRALKAGA